MQYFPSRTSTSIAVAGYLPPSYLAPSVYSTFVITIAERRDLSIKVSVVTLFNVAVMLGTYRHDASHDSCRQRFFDSTSLWIEAVYERALSEWVDRLKFLRTIFFISESHLEDSLVPTQNSRVHIKLYGFMLTDVR